MFDFTLVYLLAEWPKGPDALPRQPLVEREVMEQDDDLWLDNIALYLVAK